MSILIDQLRQAAESSPELRALLDAAADRLAMHERRARRKRTLLMALWAAHQDAKAIRRRLPGGKRRGAEGETESWWYFAPAEEVMREARRLLGLHDLLLMFTGEWVTTAGLVRLEYELSFVPTGETRTLCWETDRPKDPEDPTHRVTWAARDAQKNIALMALGIPLENDPEIQAREDEARRIAAAEFKKAELDRKAALKQIRGTAEEATRRAGALAGSAPKAPATRAAPAPDKPVYADQPAECGHDLGLEDDTPIDYGGLTAPAPLPGEEVSTEDRPSLHDLAAAAVRWQKKTGRNWAALFAEIGHMRVPDQLSLRDRFALRNRLADAQCWEAR